MARICAHSFKAPAGLAVYPPAIPSIPDDEAVAALRRRGLNLIPSGHWTEVWQQAHQTGFTVAQSAGFDVLRDIHASLVRAMSEGWTPDRFRRELTPTLQSRGWWGKTERADPLTGEVREVQLGSPRRLQTILDVNLRVSAARGDWQRQHSVRDERPWLRYTALLDNRTRPQHRRWHGIILPRDHPWWETHYPPNGWRCRCKAMSVSGEDLEAEGWTVSDAPDEGETPWVNPRTGEMLMVPRGIDPGWAYNPGNTDQAAHAARLMMDKVGDCPPAIGSEALRAAVPLTPEGERTGLARRAVARLVQAGLATWMENPGRPFPLAVLSPEDAAEIGAAVQVARISAETLAKQKAHHPELTPEDYALAQEAVEKGEKLRQDARNLAFALDRPGGVVVIVKATRIGDELYVTSLRRLSGKDKERLRAVGKLRRGKNEN